MRVFAVMATSLMLAIGSAALAQEDAADENAEQNQQQPATPPAADQAQPDQPEAADDSAQDKPEATTETTETTEATADDEAATETAAMDDTKKQEMTAHMAACLALANHAEIELAKLALDKSQNEGVKEFAQKMLDDHTAASERIKKFIPDFAVTAHEPAQTEPRATGDANAQATDPQRTQTTDQPDAADTADAAKAEVHALAKQHHDPHLMLAKKIAKNELSMTKDVLMRYEGQDFDMGYLGQQLICHTQMLAKLHAMKNQGTQEFQVVVSELIGTVEDHFQHASRLSRQIQDDEYGARRRTTTSNEQRPTVRTTRTAAQE